MSSPAIVSPPLQSVCRCPIGLRQVVAVATAMFVIGAPILATLWIFFGPVVSLSKLEKLEGVTKDEVRRIVGKPEEISDHQWLYSWWPNQGWVSIYFDDNGRVLHVNDEQVGIFR